MSPYDTLFPAGLRDAEVPLMSRLSFYHIPFTPDKYALLEGARRHAVDLGESEDVTDELWEGLIKNQMRLDLLADDDPEAYEEKRAALHRQETNAYIAREVSRHMVEQRDTQQYDLHGVALQALRKRGLDTSQYWLNVIERYKEEERELRESLRRLQTPEE